MDAWVALATAVTVFAAAVVPLYRELRRTRAEVVQAAKVAIETHVIVNQQRTDMMARIDILIAALVAAGLPIPPDESLKE